MFSLAAWIAVGERLSAAQAGVPLPLRPSAVAFDSAGDVYFADSLRHVVYEVTLAGALSIVAGSGIQGFGGDGGPATSAQLNGPHGLAVAADNTLYIADTGNARVRAVRAGRISTVAGTGIPGFSGDGGTGTTATLRRPWGLALSANGDLFIADSANHRVRRLQAGVLTTVAGNGLEGFAGDGGPALAAALGEPEGLALADDGRLFVADAASSSVRVVSAAGVISTFAGQGPASQRAAGFSGDGGAAAQARLSHPQGVACGAGGELFLADTGNQRVRKVAADGTISTVAGAGVQGSSGEGSAAASASLDGPEAVALSPFGRVWVTDARNRGLRALTADGHLFQPSGLAVRASTLAAQVSAAAGGQSSVSIRVAGEAGTPQGSVSLYDGSTLLGTASLVDGLATLLTAALGTGSFELQYGGDTLNPSVSAALTAKGLQPNVLLATASAASTRFGEVLPVLTGTLDGVAAQDAGQVQVSFTTLATSSSPAGTYPITAALSGPAASKYTLQLGPLSGQLTIAPQTSSAAMLTPAPVGYDGLPLTLSAVVSSTVAPRPTGSVNFLENGTLLATAPLVNGSATGVVQTPAVGIHAVVASYAGDNNFLPSQSLPQSVAVNILPDFTLALMSTAVPTMDPGTSATFTLQVGAAPAPFTGAVAFSTLGVPAGWTARFAPPNVIPGNTVATITLTLTASTALWRVRSSSGIALALLCLPAWILLAVARRRGRFLVTPALLLFGVAALSGCGDRVASTADIVAPHPASFTVTGTATNLAGHVVTHAVVVRYLQP